MNILRSKGGEDVAVDKLHVPDCWHAATKLKEHGYDQLADMVLECWHLCHDLLKHVQAQAQDEAEQFKDPRKPCPSLGPPVQEGPRITADSPYPGPFESPMHCQDCGHLAEADEFAPSDGNPAPFVCPKCGLTNCFPH